MRCPEVFGRNFDFLQQKTTNDSRQRKLEKLKKTLLAELIKNPKILLVYIEVSISHKSQSGQW